MFTHDDLIGDIEFLRTVVDLSEAATIILDNSGLVIFVNKRLEQVTGHTATEIEGIKSWKDFILSEDQEDFQLYLQMSRLGNDEGDRHIEVRFHDKEEKILTGLITAHHIAAKNLNLISLVDISEQKEYEQQLKHAKEAAENSERLKAAFLANMSHEIRTPINSIVGFADLLRLEGLSEEKRNLYLNQVVHGSRDLLLLIEKIITISRLDSGQLKISNREFDLNARLADIAQKAREELINRGKTQIEFNYEPGVKEKEFYIFGDPIRLSEVISNLIENAIKFTQSGRIELGYYFLDQDTGDQEGESIIFYVKDSGVGIDKSKKKVVFDRFVKIIEEEETIYKGAGLGLSICKEIVSLFGGNIWVESTRGNGSRFYFSYPLGIQKKSKYPEAEQESEGRNSLDWSNREILIAEDIESNYLYIKELLSPTNVKMLRARDGLEAVDLFNSNPGIDLVIMDILMPGMDGHEATIEIRKIKPDIPVIAQSAFTFEGDIQNGLYAGCFNDYIMKPYSRKVLLAVINKHFSEE